MPIKQSLFRLAICCFCLDDALVNGRFNNGSRFFFGRLYIASKFRDGNLEDFFSHENQHSPPALSEHGKLRISSKKSDLLECMNISTSTEPPSSYHVKVVDGPAIVHALLTKQVKTFDDYCKTCCKIVIELTLSGMHTKPTVLRNQLDKKRGKGVRKKVSGSTNLP